MFASINDALWKELLWQKESVTGFLKHRDVEQRCSVVLFLFVYRVNLPDEFTSLIARMVLKESRLRVQFNIAENSNFMKLMTVAKEECDLST